MFTPIKKLLNTSIKKSGLEDKVQAALVLEVCEKVLSDMFGQKIENKAKPIYLKNNELVIAVLSSVISQELKLRENEIIKIINQELKKEIVKRLKFLV